jgi:hypothetical protein
MSESAVVEDCRIRYDGTNYGGDFSDARYHLLHSASAHKN